MFGIVINVAAGVGAFAMGFLDDKIGGKRTIIVSLIGLIGATVLAMLATSATVFWVAGIADRHLRRPEPVREPLADGALRAARQSRTSSSASSRSPAS